MLIGGDIGGTKTNLALFDEEYNFHDLKTYPSQEYPDLRTICKEYMESMGLTEVEAACFAIAGPVQKGTCKATNLPWIVDANVLSEVFNIPTVFLINDLEANAYAIEILKEEDVRVLHPGSGESDGHQCVVSPGTGLGEAGLFWDGKRHHPFASEGGHCEFGPRDELQIDLCRYLYQKFGHASYERILSGPGIHNIYQFFIDVLHREEPAWLKEEMEETDPARVITENALNGKSTLCDEALNLFVSILGSEASNCVLKYMATGGVFLGGGIPPKLLPKLLDKSFVKAFCDKGRFRDLLTDVPIRVILDDKAALRGAAHYCFLHEAALP